MVFTTSSMCWNESAELLRFSRQQHHRQIRLDRGDLPAGQSLSLLSTISKTNQDMGRKSACDQSGYHGINQPIRGGGAINTAWKRLRKGLNLTCNLAGQRVSEGEGSESLRTWPARVIEM